MIVLLCPCSMLVLFAEPDYNFQLSHVFKKNFFKYVDKRWDVCVWTVYLVFINLFSDINATIQFELLYVNVYNESMCWEGVWKG